MPPLLKTIIITLAVAALVSTAQIIIKKASLSGTPQGEFSREDFVLWHEWVIAAVAGGVGTCFKLSHDGRPIPMLVLATTFVVGGVGCVGLPLFVNRQIFRPNRGYSWLGLVVIDLFGLACLGAVVFSGVKVYG